MPRPLIIDSTPDHSPGAQLHSNLSAATILVAVIFFFWLGVGALRGKSFTINSAAFAFLLRALTYGLPVLLAILFSLQPLRYHLREGETLLERKNYFDSILRGGWWYLLPTWPGVVLGVMLLAEHVLAPITPRATLPYWKSLLAFVLTLFGATIALGLFLTPTETRCDEEGVRCGLPHFMEWSNITKAVLRPSTIELYHRARPNLPLRNIDRADPEAEAALLHHLKRHNIPIKENEPSSQPAPILPYTVVTLAIAAAPTLAWDRRWLPRPWTYVATTAAGMLACTLLERMRGIQHFTKIRPATTTPAANPTSPGGVPLHQPPRQNYRANTLQNGESGEHELP